jgi:hypothetical protein
MQTGESESRRAQARSSSSGWPEARFRIRAANASPRTARVIFLNGADPEMALCRSRAPSAHVRVSGPAELHAFAEPGSGFGSTAAERLAQWADPVDLVLIVGDEGDDPAAGVLAARAYRGRSVTISGLIRRRPGTASTDSRTSDTLRPLCTTMMLVNDTGYLDDLLDALGVGE